MQEERDGESVNRLGFLVLSVLLANNADNRMAAMSLKEIMQTEDLDVRENTLFKKLRDYENQGYVKKGMKDEKPTLFISRMTERNSWSRIRNKDRRLYG